MLGESVRALVVQVEVRSRVEEGVLAEVGQSGGSRLFLLLALENSRELFVGDEVQKQAKSIVIFNEGLEHSSLVEVAELVPLHAHEVLLNLLLACELVLLLALRKLLLGHNSHAAVLECAHEVFALRSRFIFVDCFLVL